MTRTAVQHRQTMDALSRANEMRLGRAHLKRGIRKGTHSWRKAILHPPPHLDSCSLSGFFCILPRWGVARARKACRVLEISEGRRVGDLTDRQRERVAQYVDEAMLRRKRGDS